MDSAIGEEAPRHNDSTALRQEQGIFLSVKSFFVSSSLKYSRKSHKFSQV
jgi:hypothetical protein